MRANLRTIAEALKANSTVMRVDLDNNEIGAEGAVAIAEALKAIKEDGTYDTVLKNWGNESGAIDDFAVNP